MSAPAHDPERLLRRLEWRVIRRLDGLLQGDYRTLFRGFGLDLADLREYQYHDDVRHIDWNVTARLQTPYLREYNEDREVSAWFVLDLSGSLDFGSADKKRSVATEFVGVLARLLSRHGNRVGALCYGERVDAVIPARGGRRHVLHLLHTLLRRAPGGHAGHETDLGELLRAAERSVPRRALMFVLSDFISTPGWNAALARLAQRHEVIAVRLHDPLETELPDLGTLVFEDVETGEQLQVDTHDADFRRRFHDAAEAREAALRKGFAEAGVDALELSTADDLVDTLLRFAELRRWRSRLSGAALPAHLGGGAR
ncbi:DUF58 domain-containing protein [Azoarcus olearius]|uniref:DUF58 domain-containing protein n=1 Tax=Azoarcus sp. (strain BH72) TaxID=418699 RepID=A1K9H2_AZOSB|nr:DUF58 domain-containing protein [Azoarcus olearius]CAL95477.1 conserved hypothetical protein [Azoarcus olearius]